ncbi:MAG: YegP family protein [Pseudomonadota bacterium]
MAYSNQTSTGYYEIYRSGTEWRWRFKAWNHEIVAHGESYVSKAGAENAVRVMKGSTYSPVYDG